MKDFKEVYALSGVLILAALIIFMNTDFGSSVSSSLLYLLLFIREHPLLVLGMILLSVTLVAALPTLREKAKKMKQDLSENGDLKGSKNLHNINAAIGYLIDSDNGKIVKCYFSVSGLQFSEIDINFKKFLSEFKSNPSLKEISFDGVPIDSPFRIKQRLSQDLTWINYNNLERDIRDNKKHFMNKPNNCTERKIMHSIYSDFKNNLNELKKYNLVLYTEFEPCLYCYKLLKDVKESSTPLEFASIEVLHDALSTQTSNPFVSTTKIPMI